MCQMGKMYLLRSPEKGTPPKRGDEICPKPVHGLLEAPPKTLSYQLQQTLTTGSKGEHPETREPEDKPETKEHKKSKRRIQEAICCRRGVGLG